MPNTTLIIFDCDGVLVDSETLANDILTRHLQAAGIEINAATTQTEFRGCSAAMCIEKISVWLGKAAAVALWESMQKETFIALASVHPVAGVEAVLNDLQKKKQIFCVASAGDYEKMGITLGATGLLEKYALRLFSAIDVARSKPAPDLFLYAASEMGFAPDRCIVIEDSFLGIQAALAAGMRVCWYVAQLNEADRSRYQDVLQHPSVFGFSNMAELPNLLCSIMRE